MLNNTLKSLKKDKTLEVSEKSHKRIFYNLCSFSTNKMSLCICFSRRPIKSLLLYTKIFLIKREFLNYFFQYLTYVKTGHTLINIHNKYSTSFDTRLKFCFLINFFTKHNFSLNRIRTIFKVHMTSNFDSGNTLHLFHTKKTCCVS